MNARAALIGLVTALTGLGLSFLCIQRAKEEISGGRKVEVLVARDTIPRGKLITEEMLATRDIPIAYVDERVVRASDKSKVLNLLATTTVPVQQTVAWSDVIVSNDDQRALSTLVQPGNRATPIRVRMTEALSLVRPGDFVDILCVCGEAKDATVLLQRVLVLAAGTKTAVAQTKEDARVSNITVSASLQESQLLALALEKGALTVVVRNPQDQRVVDAPADVSMSALSDAAGRQNLQSSRRRVQAGPSQLKEVPAK